MSWNLMNQFQLKQQNLPNRNYAEPSLKEGFYRLNNNLETLTNKRRQHLLFGSDNISCLFDL